MIIMPSWVLLLVRIRMTLSGCRMMVTIMSRLPGVAGNFLSTPDAAVLDITGNIDIRFKAGVYEVA